jgi:hypothetical protein
LRNQKITPDRVVLLESGDLVVVHHFTAKRKEYAMSQTVIENAPTVTQNERTAMAQVVTRQPDGPGRRIGKRGELTGIGKVTPVSSENIIRKSLCSIARSNSLFSRANSCSAE